MSFADQVQAVADMQAKRAPFAPYERKKILSAYRYLCDTYANPVDAAHKALIGMRQMSGEQAGKQVPMSLYHALRDVKKSGHTTDVEPVADDTMACAALLTISRGRRDPRFVNLQYRDEDMLSDYLAAEYMLGRLWGYDRVAAGVYKRPDGPIRKTVLEYVRANPALAESAVELVDKFTWHPQQMKFAF